MLNNYEDFTVTDFATDDAFLRHHLAPTGSSELFWKGWLQENPAKSSDWHEAKILIDAVQLGLKGYSSKYLSQEDEAKLLTRILATNKFSDSERPSLPLWRKDSVRYMAAACVLLVTALAGIWLWVEKNPGNTTSYISRTSELAQAKVEKINSTSQIQVYYLPDSTVVSLYPSSRFSYVTGYGQKNRSVYLSGKASFDVVRSPLKPFLVYANEIVTKVLGTQFEVSAFDKDQDITVKVQSGQVSVYRSLKEGVKSAERSGVLLLPNQQVVFTRQDEQFNKGLVEKPEMIPRQKEYPAFVYEETPVSKVFEDIENAYGVDIVYSSELLKKCEMTSTLTDESLLDKLDVICRSIGATYEVVEAQIIVTSNGCQK